MPKRLPVFLGAIALAFVGRLPAAQVESTFLGGSWSDPEDWTNGVGNNGGGTTYRVVVKRFLHTAASFAPVTIDALEISGGSTLHVDHDFQVLEATSFGLAGSSSVVRFQVEGPATLDLGSLPSLVDGVLDNLSFSLMGDSMGAPATAKWAGAAIRVIAERASIELRGNTTAIRDSTTGLDALLDLEENRGTLILSGRDLFLDGDFSNPGVLEVSGGSFVVAGKLAQNQEGVLTGGRFVVNGEIAWDGADIREIDAGASLRIWSGGLEDRTTGENALSNLRENRGEIEWMGDSSLTLGDFSNIGFRNEHGFVTGGGEIVLLQATVGVEGRLFNSGRIGNFGSWQVAEEFENQGAFQSRILEVAESVTNSGSLRTTERLQIGGNLVTSGRVTSNGEFQVDGNVFNSGHMDLSDPSQRIDGDFDNTGSLRLQGTLSVAGTLTANRDGALVEGRYEILDGGTLEWSGAAIEHIGREARLTLEGSGRMRDIDSQQDALANLSMNHGTLEVMNGSHLVLAGGFTNIGETHPDGYFLGGFLTVKGGRVSAAGLLANSGVVVLQDAILDLPLGLKNTGMLIYEGSGEPERSAEVIGDVDNVGAVHAAGTGRLVLRGSLSQMTPDGVLTAGTYRAEADTSIEWKGADIREIGTGARVELVGKGAAIGDLETGHDGFRNLRRVDGVFGIFEGARVTTQSNLAVGGKLHLSGDGVLEVAQDLTFEDGASLVAGLSLTRDEWGNAREPAFGTLLVNGAAHLGGWLSLEADSEVEEWLSAGLSFQLIDAASLVGTFANEDARIDLRDESGAFLGSFLITYLDDQVILGDFSPVPEPGPLGLVTAAVILLALLAARKRGRFRSRRV